MSQGFVHDYVVNATGESRVTEYLTIQLPTSGSDPIVFTLPAGIRKFEVSFFAVQTDNAADHFITIGGAGGLKTSGYNASHTWLSASANATTDTDLHFRYVKTDATDDMNGTMYFTLIDVDTHTWSCSMIGAKSDGVNMNLIAGTVELGEVLQTLSIDPQAGNWNEPTARITVSYENPNLAVSCDSVIAGGVVQVVHLQDGEGQTGSTILPTDDSIPQNTEGDQFMELSITPVDAANKLRIDVVCIMSKAAVSYELAAAIFQDSNADAIASAVAGRVNLSLAYAAVTFTHWMTAGTASSTTFKVRGGSGASGVCTFNGQSGGRRMGGTMASSITITEYKV